MAPDLAERVTMLERELERTQALRFYRQETGAVWDEIHDAIAMGNMDYHQKRSLV